MPHVLSRACSRGYAQAPIVYYDVGSAFQMSIRDSPSRCPVGLLQYRSRKTRVVPFPLDDHLHHYQWVFCLTASGRVVCVERGVLWAWDTVVSLRMDTCKFPVRTIRSTGARSVPAKVAARPIGADSCLQLLKFGSPATHESIPKLWPHPGDIHSGGLHLSVYPQMGTYTKLDLCCTKCAGQAISGRVVPMGARPRVTWQLRPNPSMA